MGVMLIAQCSRNTAIVLRAWACLALVRLWVNAHKKQRNPKCIATKKNKQKEKKREKKKRKHEKKMV